jgi:hypothetical protein
MRDVRYRLHPPPLFERCQIRHCDPVSRSFSGPLADVDRGKLAGPDPHQDLVPVDGKAFGHLLGRQHRGGHFVGTQNVNPRELAGQALTGVGSAHRVRVFFGELPGWEIPSAPTG